MQTLLDIFQTLSTHGNKTAFINRTGIRRFKYSYKELYKNSLKIVTWLELQDVKKSDRVALWAPNSPWWGIVYWGIIVRGAIVVPIDFMSNKDRAKHIINHCEAKLLIQSQYKLDRITNKESKINSINIEELEYIAENTSPASQSSTPSPEDIAELVYTSGTTGNPKGVMLTHKNLIANLTSALQHITIKPESKFLSVLPLSHMFEQMGGFLVPITIGSTIVYNRTIKPSSIMSAFKEEGITTMMIVPRLLQALKSSIERELKHKHLEKIFRALLLRSQQKNWSKEKRKKIFLPIHKKFGTTFGFFLSGGAALDEGTARFWEYIGCTVIEGYGLTECSPVLTLNTIEEQIIGSVGKPIPGVSIDIREKEIVAKGDNIFKGYWENEQSTRDSFTHDGWFKTGDIGTRDHSGNVSIKGRKKEMIVTGAGVNVYPDDIESILNTIPGVTESCVIGIDKGHGEEINAVLILEDSAHRSTPTTNKEKIIQQANQKLDTHQQITGVFLWPEVEFPKTTTLKIQKFKVKQEILKESKNNQHATGDKLTQIVAKITDKPTSEIRNDTKLVADLGLTSIARLELVNTLEQEFRIDMEDTMIDQNTKISDVRLIITKREKVSSKTRLRLWTNKSWTKRLRKLADTYIHFPIVNHFIKLEIHGKEHFTTTKQPAIIIANHTSLLDQPVVMQALPPLWRYNTATAAGEHLFISRSKNPIRKALIRLRYEYMALFTNAFSLTNKQGFRQTLIHMGKLVDRGTNIFIFPEGERSRDGAPLPFKKGLGLMIKELKIPVIPIKITGIENILPRGSHWPKKGTIRITIGKALIFKNEQPSEILEHTRNTLINL